MRVRVITMSAKVADRHVPAGGRSIASISADGQGNHYLKHGKLDMHYATYSVGTPRGVLFAAAEPIRRTELAQDVKYLTTSIIKTGEAPGLYSYNKETEWIPDFSNSQYGVLGCGTRPTLGWKFPALLEKR